MKKLLLGLWVLPLLILPAFAVTSCAKDESITNPDIPVIPEVKPPVDESIPIIPLEPSTPSIPKPTLTSELAKFTGTKKLPKEWANVDVHMGYNLLIETDIKFFTAAFLDMTGITATVSDGFRLEITRIQKLVGVKQLAISITMHKIGATYTNSGQIIITGFK